MPPVALPANQTIYYAWSESNTVAPTFTNTLTTTNTAGAKTAQVTIPETASSSLTGSYYSMDKRRHSRYTWQPIRKPK